MHRAFEWFWQDKKGEHFISRFKIALNKTWALQNLFEKRYVVPLQWFKKKLNWDVGFHYFSCSVETGIIFILHGKEQICNFMTHNSINQDSSCTVIQNTRRKIKCLWTTDFLHDFVNETISHSCEKSHRLSPPSEVGTQDNMEKEHPLQLLCRFAAKIIKYAGWRLADPSTTLILYRR